MIYMIYMICCCLSARPPFQIRGRPLLPARGLSPAAAPPGSDPGPTTHTCTPLEWYLVAPHTISCRWWELEQLLLSMLPPHTVEYSASFLKLNEASDGVVALFEVNKQSPCHCKSPECVSWLPGGFASPETVALFEVNSLPCFLCSTECCWFVSLIMGWQCGKEEC
jgi:hypothetical protein